jgi:dephospho-CoA kinase
LNEIVWPHIATAVELMLSEKSSSDLVVVEAAILIEAGWHERRGDQFALCDEVWITSVDTEEAIARIIHRSQVAHENDNKVALISRESAASRINSQMSNEKRLSVADVVLSTLFEVQETV